MDGDDAPSAIGARAELAVATAPVRAGKRVYLLFFASHSRVDLVSTTSLAFTGSRSRHRGEIDVFGVYSPALQKVFLVPIEDVPPHRCYLRLGPTRNGQARGVRWAVDYQIEG